MSGPDIAVLVCGIPLGLGVLALLGMFVYAVIDGNPEAEAVAVVLVLGALSLGLFWGLSSGGLR